MKALLLALLVACGSSSKPPEIIAKPPEAPAMDPLCPNVKSWKLADGKLRCRELPLVVDFPANSEIERVDDENLTFIRATLDRGVLALLIEPRFDMPTDDVAGMRARIEALVKGFADDATISGAEAPPKPKATASTAIAFTTPDGGTGVVHAYLAYGWFVAIVAGGRKNDTPARPDRPLGKAFLESFQLREPPAGWGTRKVFDRIELELPLAGWEQHPETGGSEKASVLFTSISERAWIGARDLQESPKCEFFDGVDDAMVPGIMKKMFGDQIEATGKIVKVGTKAMYAESTTPAGALALYLICSDPNVYLVTVTSKRSAAELKTLLDRVTSHFPR